MDANIRTKPPHHMKKGNGKPGQRFSIERLEELCQKYKVDPAEVAVRGLQEGDITDKERLDIAIKLMEYTYAKRKSVEIGNKDGQPLQVVISSMDVDL